MPDTFPIGQSYDIDLIPPDLVYDEMQDDALVKILPPTYTGASKIVWEQKDNLYGLMPLRGLGGSPQAVTPVGASRWEMAPGFYGAFTTLDETELTQGRSLGSLADPVTVAELLKDRYLLLAGMTAGQIKQSIATLLTTGKVINRSADGRVAHAVQIKNFNALSPSVGWAANPATATPLADLRGWQNTLRLGTSSDFGPQSTLMCQTSVVNDLLATTDVKNTYKSEYGSSIQGPEGLNKLLMNFGLPKLQIYDEGYYNTLADARDKVTANYVRFLPTKTLLWVGNRPRGQQIGQWQMCNNVYKDQPAGPGQDYRVPPPSDNVLEAIREGMYNLLKFHQGPPLKYEYHSGFNGGPVVRYPSCVAGVTYT